MAYEDDDDQPIAIGTPQRIPVPIMAAAPAEVPPAVPLAAIGGPAPISGPTPIAPAYTGSKQAMKQENIKESKDAMGTAQSKAAADPSLANQATYDIARNNYLKQSGSGIDQFAAKPGGLGHKIASILARVGDVAGTALAPSVMTMIPGTTLHHQALLNGSQQRVAGDLEGEKEQLGNEKAQQDIDAAGQPKPKEEDWSVIPNMQGPNGEPLMVEKNSGQLRLGTGVSASTVPKEEQEGKTVTTANGVFQWDPKTKSYSTRVGDAPPKEGNDFEQYYQQFLKDHNAPDNSHNRLQARKEYSAANQPPQREPQQLMVVPTADGGSKVVVMTPGMTIPKGGMTVSGYNKGVEDANKESKAQTKAAEDADNELALMKQFAAAPSATNDVAMLMHFIGATKPEAMGKIRLNENEIKLFGGTRSSLGDLQALLEKAQSGQSLTPQQRQDMINTMEMISKAAHRGGEQHKVGDTKTFPNGKTGKWDGKGWVAQ